MRVSALFFAFLIKLCHFAAQTTGDSKKSPVISEGATCVKQGRVKGIEEWSKSEDKFKKFNSCSEKI
jgi:hypothetical protein